MISDPIGKVIKSYEIEYLIGTGGFGAVYRAKQAVVEREVAIKIIWPAFANHPNFIRRFEAEAQLVAGLEHPYIVPLYDYWRDPDGAYIVMRLLRGGHLRGLVNEKDWTLQDIDRLLNQVSSALALAHRYGVVHRDIKPENILMDEDGNGYLADFGIAQILSDTKDDDEFAGMGSPAYAAPEQLSGNATSPQSDIYSLGIILYELLIGKHPFPDLEQLALTELLELRSSKPLPPVTDVRSDLSPALNEILQRATQLDPQQRFPDALSLSRAFTSAIGNTKRTSAATFTSIDELVPNPYKGLRAFQEKDAPNFFGREALVQRLVDRFVESGKYTRFLAVVGPSGSGKSSVIKAGLIPALRQNAIAGSSKWFFDEMVPGSQPFQELENTLISVAVNTPSAELLHKLRTDETGLLKIINAGLPSDDDSELFLFIDQFEEVFTQVMDEKEISNFLSSLYVAVTAPDSRLRVVITIRADFYDRPLLQPRLSNLVRERTEVVVPLSQDELERVIVEPAKRVGVQFDSGLVAAIVAEIKEQPGALPLLQYSLSELFERRDDTLIMPQAYKELGGVRGALARRADELYDNMSPGQQEATRQLFLRLITLGEGTEDTRRRALLSELTSLKRKETDTEENIVQQVVDILGRARLLTFDRDPITRSPTVEVTHEAIIREWQTLRDWLDESRNDVRMQRKLSVLASEWLQERQDPSLLIQGVRLEQFEEWQTTTNLVLTEEEQRYLDESISERLRREEEERLREERERMLERRSVTRLRILFGVLLTAFVVTLGLLALAFNAQAEATRSAQFSQNLALAASAGRELGDGDVDLALALAVEANSNASAPDLLRSLSEVAFANGTKTIFEGHTAGVLSVDIHTETNRVVSGSFDSNVILWNALNGEILHRMTGHGGDVESVAFSPDGAQVVSGAADFTVILWNADTGEEIRRLTGHRSPVRSVAYSPDGNYILGGSRGIADNPPLIVLWDSEDGRQLRTYEGHNAGVQTLAISPDSLTFLSGARNGELKLWDVNSGEVIQELIGHATAIEDISFDPDGTRAVSASGDGTIIIWSLPDGNIIHRFQISGGDVRAVAFTPDGNRIISGAGDGVLQIWDADAGLEISSIQAHYEATGRSGVIEDAAFSNAIEGIDISSDGLLAVSGSRDRTIRLWNIGTPGLFAALSGEANSRVTGVSFGANDDQIVYGDVQGFLRAWNIGTREQQTVLQLEDSPIRTLDINRTATHALLGEREPATDENVIAYVDLQTGETIRLLRGHASNILAVRFFNDRALAVSSDQNGVTILWDLETGEERRRFEGHRGAVHSLAIRPDENSIVTGSSDSTAILWDIQTGDIIRRFEGHAGTVFAVDISPDGSILATGSRDTLAILWDIETGRNLAALIGDADTVWSLAFKPSGDALITGTASGSLIMWDVETGTAIQRFDAGERSVFTLSFSPSGNRVVSGQEDGSVIVWNTLTGTELLEWTRANRYIRDFTCIERDQYRIEPPCDT